MKTAVIYVHGKGGSAAEAEHYQPLFSDGELIGFDYSAETPWEAKAEFTAYFDRMAERCDTLILIANSLGAYFAMQAERQDKLTEAYLLSPVVDMERMIADMMAWAGVTEDGLRERGELGTAFGETLSWDYLCYVRAHPTVWSVPTHILRGENDTLVALDTVTAFAEKCGATLDIMPGGEHWFHTPEQMAYLDRWIVRKRGVSVLLTAKDDKAACACADRIVSESRESDVWYGCFDEFAAMLRHPKSLVRNRAIAILAANARWDEDDRLDRILPEYLSHITDEKPITARQCVKALAEIGRAKPRLIPALLSALQSAELSRYKDSMRPLIEKDIRETVEKLRAPYARPLLPGEIPEAIYLIWEVFLEFEAPVYNEEGVRTFRASLDDPVRTASLRWYGAFEDGQLVGVLCMRAPQHIGGFFVTAAQQGKGHGRRLFERMKRDYERQEFTVNSSPYAVPIYQKLGFCATDTEQTVDGLRFTPMQYDEK